VWGINRPKGRQPYETSCGAAFEVAAGSSIFWTNTIQCIVDGNRRPDLFYPEKKAAIERGIQRKKRSYSRSPTRKDEKEEE
jgi:hypothetical protein